MKYLFFLFISFSLSYFSTAQQRLPVSLLMAFQKATDDSMKFKISRSIYTFYEETNGDSALYYAQLRYAIAKKYNRKIEEAYLQG